MVRRKRTWIRRGNYNSWETGKTLNAINESSFVVLCAGLLSLFHRDLIWDEKTTTVTTREKMYDKNVSVTFIRSVSLSYPSRGNSPFLSGNLTSVSPAFFFFFPFLSFYFTANGCIKDRKEYKNLQYAVRCAAPLLLQRSNRRTGWKKKEELITLTNPCTHTLWLNACLYNEIFNGPKINKKWFAVRVFHIRCVHAVWVCACRADG